MGYKLAKIWTSESITSKRLNTNSYKKIVKSAIILGAHFQYVYKLCAKLIFVPKKIVMSAHETL